MKKMIIFRQILMIITGMLLIMPCSAGGSEPERESPETLVRQFRFARAESLLRKEIGGGNPGEKQSMLLAVCEFQKPGWYQEDLSGIKACEKLSIPFIVELIKSPMPDNPAPVRASWIIDSKLRFIKALSNLDFPGKNQMLIEVLKMEPVRLRLTAIEEMGRLKVKDGAELLFEYLKTDRIPVSEFGQDLGEAAMMEELARNKAIEALVLINNRDMIPLLKKELDMKGSPDREIAAAVLTGMKIRQMKETYVNLLHDSSERIRVFAASALKDMGDDRGLPALIELFDKGGPGVKLWMFRVISQWKNRDAAVFFVDKIQEMSVNAPISYIPLIGLGRVPPIERISDPEMRLFTQMAQTLAFWKNISPPMLTEIIENEKGPVRYIAVEILAETGSPEGVPVFRQMLDEKEDLPRYFAAWALARLNDRESIPKIRNLLTQSNVNLQSAAAWALAVLGDDSGYGKALNLLDNDMITIRATALAGLYQYGKKESAEKVRKALTEGELADPVLVRSAVILLGLLDGEKALEVLKILADNPNPNSFYAAEAAYRITSKETPFRNPNVFQTELYMYGSGVYTDADFARIILLYLSLNREKYGGIGNFVLGYIKEFPVYGDYGQVISKNSTIPVFGNPQLTEPSGAILKPGQQVVVVRRQGNVSEICTFSGRVGWIDSSAVTFLEKPLDYTGERFRQDMGYRWDEDLVKIIEHAYLSHGEITVSYTNPVSRAASEYVKGSMNLTLGLAGQGDLQNDWDPVTKVVDRGKKVINVKTLRPRRLFTFTFDSTGMIKNITIK